MKSALSLVLFIVLAPVFAAGVAAQDASGVAAQTADDLRVQLLEIQAKENELQARGQQLDEALKPENIERSLAGVGSTRPEELRELRRRQLSSEREGVRSQLRIVATSRERLEAAIRTAEAKAYQESAEGRTSFLEQMLVAPNLKSTRWLVGMFASLVAILGIAFVIILTIRSRAT
jgi:hypothetical protein